MKSILKKIKIAFHYIGNENTWSFLPTIQGWYVDLKTIGHGDNYAIVLRFLNRAAGINICIKNK
jgi:hypothetical protein